MIALRRPTDHAIEAYRLARGAAEPTCPPAPSPPDGCHVDRFVRELGTAPTAFERAGLGLRRWQAHRGAGVEVFPTDAPLAEGQTVAILTRQLGLWVLAACRVTDLIDEPDAFGFTYATLPDHPASGYETFIVRRTASSSPTRGGTGSSPATALDTVSIEIEAVSKPGIALVRLATPLTRALQRRAGGAYLDALQRWTSAGDANPKR